MPKREKEFEARELKLARKRGGDLWKFVSPGRRSVPDRLRLGGFVGLQNAVGLLREIIDDAQYHNTAPMMFGEEEVRQIVAHVIGFAEFKAPGKRPTSAQRRMINQLERWGLTVEVIDK